MSELQDAIRTGSEDEIFRQLCHTIEEQGEIAESVIAETIAAEREPRVPSPDAIERVAEGLAAWAIDRRDHAKFIGCDRGRLPGPDSLPLLLTLLGIPVDPMPDWAQEALDGHHGTPASLVDALRRLRDSHKGEDDADTDA